jgi:hypothetical protein
MHEETYSIEVSYKSNAHRYVWTISLYGTTAADGPIMKRLPAMKTTIGWEIVDWIHLAQDTDLWWALVKTRNVGKGGEFLD